MALYDLELHVEELPDGDYRYLATSPNLPNLTVVGDTIEEVLELAPTVAAALISSMEAHGDPLPNELQVIATMPFRSHVAVAV